MHPIAHFALFAVMPLSGTAMTRPAVIEPRTYHLALEPPTPPTRRLQLVAGLGVVDRASTGTLAGFGYDASTVPTAGFNARVFTELHGCNCLSHGLDLGFTYAAGPTFGAFHEAAFRHHLVDVAYAFRVELPCMRRPHRRMYVTGLLGVAGTYADAGLGDVSRETTDQINARNAASTRDDHFALGWRLGASFDVTMDSLLVGAGLDLREVYAVGGGPSRTFMLGASLRLGADIGW